MVEFSVFKLLIASIVTIALLLILINLFSNSPEETIRILRESIDLAQANEGKLFTKDLLLNRDFAVKASLLDSPSRNARFECTSAGTCDPNKITIEPRKLIVKNQFLVPAHFRCKRKEILSDCVVYFGETPANLETNIISLEENVKTGENISIAFKTTNNGSLDAVDNHYKIEIFQIKIDGPIENLILKRELFGEIDLLNPKESKIVSQNFTLDLGGNYLARITAEGEDSGVGLDEKRFTAEGGISASCVTNGTGRTFLDGSVCKTPYLCSGCEYGYECSAKWKEEGLDPLSIDEVFRDKVYVKTDPIIGQCN